MRTSFKFGAAILGAAMTLASMAGATTIQFNVNSGAWQTGPQSYGAASVYGGVVDTNGVISRTDAFLRSWSGSSGGLGICSASRVSKCTTGTSESNGRDEHTIDGGGPNEIAILDFGATVVEVISVTFAYWDSNDDFDFAAYTSLLAGTAPSIWDEDIDISGSGTRTYTFAPGALVGSIIGFGADANSDEFKLQSVQYSTVVPLPAAFWMLLAAVGGLGAMRRRRSISA